MRITLLLKLAAGLAAVQGTAHGALFLSARPRHGPAEEAVVEAMRTQAFDFGGARRSYWDFYTGYGLEAAAVCLLEAALLLMLARIARVNPRLVGPSVLLLIAANLGHIALTARYFFYVPILFDGLIALVLLSATLTLRREARLAV